MRAPLRAAALLIVSIALTPAFAATPMSVHQEAVLVDLHADTLLDLAAGRRSLDGSTAGGHIDLPRLRRGGVDVQVFAAFVHPREAAVGRQRVRELIAAFDRAMDRHAGQIAAVRTVAEIEAAQRAGKIAAVLAVENGGDAIGADVDQVDQLYRAGVRMMGLTWNPANLLADGASESRHRGLTALGRQVVDRMQRLGMVIDVSHLSIESLWEVLAVSRGPVVATHSDAAAVHQHRRNLSDAQLRALAGRGGVVGVNFFPPFLGAATLDRVVAHIDHMVRVMGVDHVALGSDFDGITAVPAGLEDVSRLPALTAALLARGYRPEDVHKILGGNALRVFRQVWGR